MRIRTRMLGTAVVVVAVSAFGTMGAAAHAEEPNPTVEPASAKAQAQDYRVPGVRIFALPQANSTVRGLGYPGQGLIVHRGMTSEPYTCDNGVTSTTWYDQTNLTTGVRGWIPMCNYTGHA